MLQVGPRGWASLLTELHFQVGLLGVFLAGRAAGYVLQSGGARSWALQSPLGEQVCRLCSLAVWATGCIPRLGRAVGCALQSLLVRRGLRLCSLILRFHWLDSTSRKRCRLGFVGHTEPRAVPESWVGIGWALQSGRPLSMPRLWLMSLGGEGLQLNPTVGWGWRPCSAFGQAIC